MNIDQPIEVRKGEEIDTEKLGSYLESINPDWSGEVSVKQFPSGYSNLTYFLEVNGHELVLRRPPFGANVKSGHDMSREYRVMKALKDNFGKVPIVYAHTADEDILGAEFYIMERVKGVVVRGRGLKSGGVEAYPQIADAWLNTLVELHSTDYAAAGLEDLGRPKGYNRRQIEGWTRRYVKAKTGDAKIIEKVMEWLNQRIPEESEHSLIHNDYKYDNVMFNPSDWSEVLAVLDWEMATLGDPLMDFGTTISYWSEEEDIAHFGELISLPTYLEGNPSKVELLKMYEERSGRDLSNIVYYYVYGLFKTAVVVQQIFYRYFHGHTQDKRFAGLGEAAKMMCFKASRAIEKDRIDQLF